MPTISRAKRQKARIKRSNSLLKRGLRQVMERANQVGQQANQNLVLLVVALAQAGGEITVPKALIDQVAGDIPHLGFAVVAGAEDGSFRIYTTDDRTETVLDQTLPAESLDEMKARMDRAHNGEVPEAPRGSVAAQLAAARTADLGGETDHPDESPIDPTDAAGDPA